MWIDAHCHLAHPSLWDDVDAVLARSRTAGVGGWVQGGVDPDDWARQTALAARFEGVVTAFGLHPWWVARSSDEQVEGGLRRLEEQLGGAAFIGEIGLDRAVRGLDEAGYRRQKAAFVRQLRLAHAANKPVVLHAVRAHQDILTLLSENGGLPAGGIVHAFSGNTDMAAAYARLGLHLSINGAAACSGFKKLKEALPSIPRQLLLVETDAPDGPFNHMLREPRDLLGIAAAIGALIDAKADDLLDASAAALRRLLERTIRNVK